MEITDRMIERTIYWLIIILLVALVAFLYFRTSPCDGTVAATENETVQTAENTTTPLENESTTPAESCTDAEKNQDEADVDCGGICGACAEGKECVRNTDCTAGSCKSGLCNATKAAEPSSLTINKLDYTSPESSAARITGIGITIHNGGVESKEFTVELYVKNEDGDYLNQKDGTDAGDEKAFATIDLPFIAAGKTETFTYDVRPLSPSAGYLIANDYYGAGDAFLVEARFLDGDTLIKTVEWKK